MYFLVTPMTTSSGPAYRIRFFDEAELHGFEVKLHQKQADELIKIFEYFRFNSPDSFEMFSS